MALSSSVKLDEAAEFALLQCEDQDSDSEKEDEDESPYRYADTEALPDTNAAESWDY